MVLNEDKITDIVKSSINKSKNADNKLKSIADKMGKEYEKLGFDDFYEKYKSYFGDVDKGSIENILNVVDTQVESLDENIKTNIKKGILLGMTALMLMSNAPQAIAQKVQDGGDKIETVQSNTIFNYGGVSVDINKINWLSDDVKAELIKANNTVKKDWNPNQEFDFNKVLYNTNSNENDIKTLESAVNLLKKGEGDIEMDKEDRLKLEQTLKYGAFSKFFAKFDTQRKKANIVKLRKELNNIYWLAYQHALQLNDGGVDVLQNELSDINITFKALPGLSQTDVTRNASILLDNTFNQYYSFLLMLNSKYDISNLSDEEIDNMEKSGLRDKIVKHKDRIQDYLNNLGFEIYNFSI